MIVLIPAKDPGERLIELAASLLASGTLHLVIVDDGSGPAARPVFARLSGMGAHVLAHDANRGKGAALRTGLEYIATGYPGEPVVCADADGQHRPGDILAAGAALACPVNESREQGQPVPPEDPRLPDIVLGVREFGGGVPARSRLGNIVTAGAFTACTGLRVRDTQTGLRAFPGRMIPWLLGIGGDRYEYELRVLLRAARDQLTIAQVPIETVYLEENSASHFRPVIDSLRVLGPMLAFAASSFTGFIVDFALLAVLLASTGNLMLSVAGARAVSAAVNFSINRWWVFRDIRPRAPLRSALARYAALAVALLGANVVLMNAMTGAGIAWGLAKIVTESVLFACGYAIQRAAVFARADRRGAPGGSHPQECPGCLRARAGAGFQGELAAPGPGRNKAAAPVPRENQGRRTEPAR